MRLLLLLLALTLAAPALWLLRSETPPDAPTPGAPTARTTQLGTISRDSRFDAGRATDAAPGTPAGNQGIWLGPDGTRLVGAFDENGQLTGPATRVTPDGSRHDGRFEAGRPSGPGVNLDPDGSLEAGVWRQGRLEGFAHQIDAAGQRFSGPASGSGSGWCIDRDRIRSCAGPEALRGGS